MKKSLILLVLLLFSSNLIFGQSENVGVNTTTPDNSAALHVTYVTTPKGILVPRMTNAQRATVPSPANGLLIFNTDNNRFEVYDASATSWRGLLTNANVGTAAWARTGNVGTVPGTDFLGTTDNTDFTMFSNNIERLRLKANGNFGIGTNNPTSLLSVGLTSQFQVNGTGAINAATGITSSGNIIFSGLAANQFVKTTAGGQLSTFSFGRDLSVTGTDTALVVGIQGRNVASTAPTDGQVLQWNSTLTQWQPGTVAGGGSGNTLDAAYDQGGNGNGRNISVTDGAVQLTGTNAADETIEITNSGNGGVAYLNNTGSGKTLLVESNGDTTLTVESDGKVKVGKDGTGITDIIKRTVSVNVPALNAGAAQTTTITFNGAKTTGVVSVSPNGTINSELIVGYAFVNATDSVRILFYNVSGSNSAAKTMDFYITVIN